MCTGTLHCVCTGTLAIAVNASRASVCTNQEGEDMRILKYLATFEQLCDVLETLVTQEPLILALVSV